MARVASCLQNGLIGALGLYLAARSRRNVKVTTGFSTLLVVLVAAAVVYAYRSVYDRTQGAPSALMIRDTGPPNVRALGTLATVIGKLAASHAAQQRVVNDLKADAEARDNKVHGLMGVINIDLAQHSAQQKQLVTEQHYGILRKLLQAAYEN